LLKGRN